MVSHFVMHELESVLAGHPSLLEDPAKALMESYVKVDESLAAAKVCLLFSYVRARAAKTGHDSGRMQGLPALLSEYSGGTDQLLPLRGYIRACITCAVRGGAQGLKTKDLSKQIC